MNKEQSQRNEIPVCDCCYCRKMTVPLWAVGKFLALESARNRVERNLGFSAVTILRKIDIKALSAVEDTAPAWINLSAI